MYAVPLLYFVTDYSVNKMSIYSLARLSSAVHRHTEHIHFFSPPNTQISTTSSLTITHCSSDNLIAWDFISISYFGAVAFTLLFLSLQTTRVPDHFSQEGNQTSITVLITLLVFTPCLMLAPSLDADPRLYILKFWLSALVTIVLPDILLGTLFLNKVSLHMKGLESNWPFPELRMGNCQNSLKVGLTFLRYFPLFWNTL